MTRHDADGNDQEGGLEIRVARHIGFCPGVRRAIEISERTLEKSDGPIFTLGPIIHNPQVVDFLAHKGIEALADRPKTLKSIDLSERSVVIRSHGVSPRTLDALHRLGAIVVDATCPIVKKAQKAARTLVEEGYRLIIIGSGNHPEVQAILGQVKNHAVVLSTQKELGEWWRDEGRRSRRVGIIGQTTLDVSTYRGLISQLIGKVSDLRVMDTLCHSTMARQQEARRLAQNADLVLVLGGRNSSNTASLTRICLSSGTPALQIESPEELDISSLAEVRKLAIVGGASTPEWTVDGVCEKIRRAGPIRG